MELRFFLLETVNATPSPQWIYFRIATVLAIFFAGSALSPLAARFVPAPVRAIVTWPAWFYAATILLIAWLRYPGLLSPHLNPDEAQFTAAAAKLLLDPIFWRSVDTGTSGPFNIYPLTLPHLLGWSPDYASSRVIALLMLSGSVLLLHRALTWTYTDSSARVALMPLVFSIALLQDSDYVHYSSEHGPLLLLSTALFFICRISAPSQSEARWLSFATGLALGSIPYAKMQALPMAIALALIFVHVQWAQCQSRKKLPLDSLTRFAAGALLPTALVLILLNHFDLWQLVWDSYFKTYLFYYSRMQDGGRAGKLENLLRLFLAARELYPLIVAIALLSWGQIVASLLKPSDSPTKTDRMRSTPMLYAILFCISALFSVGRPGNPFLHYTLLLLAPFGFLLGTLIGEFESRLKMTGRAAINLPAIGMAATASALLAMGAIRLAEVYLSGNPYLQRAANYLDSYRGPVSSAILKVAEPGSGMTVWGWSPELYVETGLTQATRYGITFWQAEKHPLQDRFMEEFVTEFKAARPEIFVDAMSSSMFYWNAVKDRTSRRHEAFPALSEVVFANYDLVREIQGVRIYKRKSRGRE